jgi:hypothetical protein
MRHHKLVLGIDGKVTSLSEENVVNAVRTGMDHVLGEGSSSLVFKTLQYIYHIREDAIFQNPSICFNKFEKMLGELAASKIRSAASRELRKLINQEEPLRTALEN